MGHPGQSAESVRGHVPAGGKGEPRSGRIRLIYSDPKSDSLPIIGFATQVPAAEHVGGLRVAGRILGCHRSGTSLLCAIVRNLSDVHPEQPLGPDLRTGPGNPTGFHESASLFDVKGRHAAEAAVPGPGRRRSPWWWPWTPGERTPTVVVSGVTTRERAFAALLRLKRARLQHPDQLPQ